MACKCPHPDLCVLLGQCMHGPLLETWQGRGLPEAQCQEYREHWLAQAGRTMADVPEGLRPGATAGEATVPPVRPAVAAPSPAPKAAPAPRAGLGDMVAGVLSALGVPKCGGCAKRQEALNRAGRKLGIG